MSPLSRLPHALLATTWILLMLACAKGGPDPRKLGVFADSDQGTLELTYYSEEIATLSQERFHPIEVASVPAVQTVTAFYVHLPDVQISESKLYSAEGLEVVDTFTTSGKAIRVDSLRNERATELPVTLEEVSQGLYRATSPGLASRSSGFVYLKVVRGLGSDDRIYPVRIGTATPTAAVVVPTASLGPGADAPSDTGAATLLLAQGALRGAKYDVSRDWRLLRNGKAVTIPLAYAGKSTPKDAKLSQPSPSGRFIFIDLCDEWGCDDQRLVDFERGTIIDHIDSKSSRYRIFGMKGGGGSAARVTADSWCPTEHFVLFGEYLIDLSSLEGSIINSPPFDSRSEEAWLLLANARWISSTQLQASLDGATYIIDAPSWTARAV